MIAPGDLVRGGPMCPWSLWVRPVPAVGEAPGTFTPERASQLKTGTVEEGDVAVVIATAIAGNDKPSVLIVNQRMEVGWVLAERVERVEDAGR